MGIRLSAKQKYHLKIIAGSAALALVLTLLQDEKNRAGIFLLIFFLLSAQFELFLWMAPKLLQFKTVPAKKDLIKSILYKLVVFYGCVLVISLLIAFLSLLVFFVIRGESLESHFSYFIGQGIWNFLKYYAIALSISTICYFYFQWKAALEREQRLQQEKLLFQFETLKSQVNPHFLFNSLNTLSSLVGTDAAQAEQFTRKLSAIYHYVLENRETECIDLALELDFVRDYFYLQQIRDGDKIALSIDVPHAERYKILPISIQLLVENALKHNLATSGRPLKISIYAEQDCIVVKNNLQRKTILENSKKIGLNNLRERMNFSTGRTIKVVETREEFSVSVPLITLV
jgi:two-component system LytT family sensor kinase